MRYRNTGYNVSRTDLAISPTLRNRTKNMKKPVVMGGAGKFHKITAARNTNVRRGQ